MALSSVLNQSQIGSAHVGLRQRPRPSRQSWGSCWQSVLLDILQSNQTRAKEEFCGRACPGVAARRPQRHRLVSEDGCWEQTSRSVPTHQPLARNVDVLILSLRPSFIRMKGALLKGRWQKTQSSSLSKYMPTLTKRAGKGHLQVCFDSAFEVNSFGLKALGSKWWG